MTNTTQLLLITTATLLFVGCSNQEMQVANTLANTTASTSGVNQSPMNSSDVLPSSASQIGAVQGQAIGAATLANPVVVGMGAYAAAQDAKIGTENKAAHKKLSNVMANSDQVNNNVANSRVVAYNQKMGTNYRTMEELQDSVKVSGYNEEQGTQFKTFTQVREDYNKKNGTAFASDKELRDWIAENR